MLSLSVRYLYSSSHIKLLHGDLSNSIFCSSKRRAQSEALTNLATPLVSKPEGEAEVEEGMCRSIHIP